MMGGGRDGWWRTIIDVDSKVVGADTTNLGLAIECLWESTVSGLTPPKEGM